MPLIKTSRMAETTKMTYSPSRAVTLDVVLMLAAGVLILLGVITTAFV